MTTRRSFLGSILACAAAPAIVKAEILMPVRKIIVPDFEDAFYRAILDAIRYGTGMHTTAYTGHGGPTQADQMALNREFRRLMDNVTPAPFPRFQTVIDGKRRPDLDARFNAAWTLP